MLPQSYKVVATHAHEISGWKIISIIIHEWNPNLGGINGDIQSDLATLTFKNREQTQGFHIIIIKLQNEINLYE